MSTLFNEDSSPQPPKLLTTAAEINGNFRTLLNNNLPLKIRFPGREQRYLSYIVAVDRENASLALDEFVPNTSQRLLQSGEEFHVEAHIDGVRINWSHQQTGIPAEINGHPCLWFKFPEEMHHHQRRGTFRANVIPDQPASIVIAGIALATPVRGRLLDISATGCKVHIDSADTKLKAGQLYEKCNLIMPHGSLDLSVEVRHVQVIEDNDISKVGLRFHQADGVTQRNIERYVYQLQREARRDDGGELF